jgi:hypothetical protein
MSEHPANSNRVSSSSRRLNPDRAREPSTSAPKPTRADRYAEFSRLRKSGLTTQQIAGATSFSVTYVRDVLTDPAREGDRARKTRYRGTCADCGRSTHGSNGPSRAPTRCTRCENATRRYWTKGRIIAAIKAWAEIHGEPPTASEWNPKDRLAPAWTRKRKAETPGRWPALRVVQGAFGSWATAIETAGYPRPRRGPRRSSTLAEVVPAPSLPTGHARPDPSDP